MVSRHGGSQLEFSSTHLAVSSVWPFAQVSPSFLRRYEMRSIQHAVRSSALAAVVALLGFDASASAQNLLGNASFEDPIASSPAPFTGRWEPFTGGNGAGVGNDTTSPRTGASHLNMNIVSSDNNFAGVFQDITGLVPGTPVEFSAWYRTPSSLLDLGFESRIEWRDANGQISSTPNFTAAPGNAYTQFSVSSIVPAGADRARAVFAVQTFGGEPTNNGIIYLDDASFVVVPEPASIALLVGAGAVLLRRRK